MFDDGIMIILIFASILMIPTAVVFAVLSMSKKNRKRKKESYMGVTQGRISKIVSKGVDAPWVIYVDYHVAGIDHQIKETAKMKSTLIKIGKIPVGQRKTFVMGQVKEGDLVEIRYDTADPSKAILYENDGVVTG